MVIFWCVRVSSIHPYEMTVLVGVAEIRAELTGRFRFLAESDEALLVVCDWTAHLSSRPCR